VLAFLGGALTKDTAVAFLPGAFLLITAQLRGDHALGESPSRQLNNKVAIIWAGVGTLLLLYYVIRKVAFTTNANHVGLTIRIAFTDWNHTLFVVLRALGFYLKKIIVPYPLNFAIIDVDSLYEILAAPLVGLCVYIGARKTPASAMFTAGMFLLVPSFLIAFGQIAWTPYAERYVYMTLAFVIVAVAVYGDQYMKKKSIVLPRSALVALLIIMLATTLSRGIIWQDDMKLCRDTIEKSPLSRNMRITYSSLLIEKGDYVEALNQLEQGRALPFIGYDERIDHNTAYIYYKQGRLDDAIKISQTALHKSQGAATWALENLASFLEEKKQSCKNRTEKYFLDKQIFAYNQQLYKLNHDPHLLYELGVTAEALGERQRAVGLFQQASAAISGDDQYKRNIIGKLKALSGISLPAHAEHL
jgi:tetratricopeptide (TPR) repeat protein